MCVEVCLCVHLFVRHCVSAACEDLKRMLSPGTGIIDSWSCECCECTQSSGRAVVLLIAEPSLQLIGVEWVNDMVRIMIFSGTL